MVAPQSMYGMGMNKLMGFRTAYLRLIAQWWTDSSFQDALRGCQAASDTINLMRTQLKFEWPWPKACRPWFVPLDGNPERDQLRFYEDQSEWIWPSNLMDSLTLHVPLTPKCVNKAAFPPYPSSLCRPLLYYYPQPPYYYPQSPCYYPQPPYCYPQPPYYYPPLPYPPPAAPTDLDISPGEQALALAELYRERSAMFSDNWGEDWTIRGGIDSASSPVKNGLTGSGVGLDNQDLQPLTGGFYPAEHEFPAFQVALHAAIAAAWDNAQIATIEAEIPITSIITKQTVLRDASNKPLATVTVPASPSTTPTTTPPAISTEKSYTQIGIPSATQSPVPKVISIRDGTIITIKQLPQIAKTIPTPKGTLTIPTNPPVTIIDFKTLLTTDAKTALSLIRGYQLPWTMTLNVVDDMDARWDSPNARWIYSRPNDLVLYLPSRPQDSQCEPIALAMYNGTGSSYPFSCTC